jgi:hypothetical protein
VPTKHKSFDEVFQARLHSPVARLREGILLGPKIGDNDDIKQPSLLAVSIDGSISVIKNASKRKLQMYQWLEEYLFRMVDDTPLFQPGNHSNSIPR